MSDLCLKITKSVAVSFLEDSPVSWKALCKYYSGDSNCKPNSDVYKFTSAIDSIEAYINSLTGDSGLPSITSNPVIASNWKDNLQLCEYFTPEKKITSCDEINWATNTDTFYSDPSSINAQSKDARCTELGYYYDLKCKRDGTTVADYKCVDTTDCDKLDMYGTAGLATSTQFCGGLLGCMRDNLAGASKCVTFDKANKANFVFGDLDNTGMTLTQIQEQCAFIGEYMNFVQYKFDQHNFEKATKTKPVCIDDVGRTINGAVPKVCEIFAALGGMYWSSGPTQSASCEPIHVGTPFDVNTECPTLKFELPTDYSYANTAHKININPYYANDISPVFGEYLCNQMGCAGNSRQANIYDCKKASCTDATPQRCGVNGTCIGMQCVCKNGFTGDLCEIPPTTTTTTTPTTTTTTPTTTTTTTTATTTTTTPSAASTTPTGASQLIQFGITLLAVALI